LHGTRHGRTRRTLRLARKQAGEEPAPGPGRWLDIWPAMREAVRWFQLNQVFTCSNQSTTLCARSFCFCTHTVRNAVVLMQPTNVDRTAEIVCQGRAHIALRIAVQAQGHARSTLVKAQHCMMQTSAARVAVGSRRHHTAHAAAYVTVCQAEQALAPAPAARCLSCCAYCRNSSSASPTLASSGAPLVLAAKCLQRAAAEACQVPFGLPVHSSTSAQVGLGNEPVRIGQLTHVVVGHFHGLHLHHLGASARSTAVKQNPQTSCSECSGGLSTPARPLWVPATSRAPGARLPQSRSFLSSRVHLRTGRPPSPSPSYSTLQMVLVKVE